LKEIKKLKPPKFWKGVWPSVLGAVGYTLIIGVVIFLLWASRFGCNHVIDSLYKLVKEPINSTESSGTSIQQLENKSTTQQLTENLSRGKPREEKNQGSAKNLFWTICVVVLICAAIFIVIFLFRKKFNRKYGMQDSSNSSNDPPG
jgi:CDP-diglyceride synthetase